MVADRHPDDVGGEIPQGGAAVARDLRVDDPVAMPHRWVDQVQQALAFEDIPELGPEDNRQGLDRYEEVGPRRQPARAVGAETAARYDVVHVRMVLQRPAPGVQDAEEAEAIRA